MGLLSSLWWSESPLSPLECLPHTALREVARQLDGLSLDFLSVTSKTMRRRLSEVRIRPPVKEISRLELTKAYVRLKLTPSEPVCRIVAECGPHSLELYITDNEIITARDSSSRRSLLCQKGTRHFTVRKIPSDVVVFDDILKSVIGKAICLNHSFFPSGKRFRWRDEEINVDRKKMECYE
ncbi:hypothetical protein PMAYCL1PPCAC_28452, partial [Pristionchus mayeri]